MSNALLSVQDVIDLIGTRPSPEIILRILSEGDIDCFIKCPRTMKVYAGRNLLSTFHEIVQHYKPDPRSSTLPKPIEVRNAFLLGLSKNTLKELAIYGNAEAVIFEKVLSPELIDVYSMLLDYSGRYAIASDQKVVSEFVSCVFTEYVSIVSTDLFIRRDDYPMLKSVYFKDHVRDSLRVVNPKISILNFVSYDFYKYEPGREYDRSVVAEMLSNEKVDGVGLTSFQSGRLAAIINKNFNIRQGVSGSNAPEKLILNEEMMSYHRDGYFSDALVLVNYLAEYNVKSPTRRSDVESLALSCGLSATLAEIISKML